MRISLSKRSEESFYLDEEFNCEEFMQELTENNNTFTLDIRELSGNRLRTLDDFVEESLTDKISPPTFRTGRGRGKPLICKKCGVSFNFRERIRETSECPFCFSKIR